MRTVDNPKELFRKIDATDIDDDKDSYSFNVAEGDMETLNREQLSIDKRTVELEDFSDPADDFFASLEEIEEKATVIEDKHDHDADVDAKFVTEEDGETVVYMADTNRMGYEIIKSFSKPRLAGYVVIFPDALVKVEP